MKGLGRTLKYLLIIGLALVNFTIFLRLFEKTTPQPKEKPVVTDTLPLRDSKKSTPLAPTESEVKVESHMVSLDEKMQLSKSSYPFLMQIGSLNLIPSQNIDVIADSGIVKGPTKKIPLATHRNSAHVASHQQPAIQEKPWLLPTSRFNFKDGKIPIQVGFFYTPNIGTQDIGISGLIGDRFTVTSQDHVNILVGIGYFVEDTKEMKQLQLFYGVNAYYLARTNVNGYVYQEHLYNNLSYQYQQTNIPIYASAKGIIQTKYERYSIALDAGIGPNIIQANNFVETSLDGGVTLPDNIFSGKTTVNFSAAVGIGLRINHVLKDRPFECGYRFFYLGNGTLSAKNDQVLNTLNTGNNYAHTMICAVTF